MAQSQTKANVALTSPSSEKTGKDQHALKTSARGMSLYLAQRASCSRSVTVTGALKAGRAAAGPDIRPDHQPVQGTEVLDRRLGAESGMDETTTIDGQDRAD